MIGLSTIKAICFGAVLSLKDISIHIFMIFILLSVILTVIFFMLAILLFQYFERGKDLFEFFSNVVSSTISQIILNYDRLTSGTI
jgi:hypothetical protein